ncbi:MAG TPA: BTAD domain-containing putative transcriptional regulator [Streptosporangiaceae bacterium]|nr:BTAD domain-containing putative transcriptional regulator [Streptosporangiaceae bacterium]
MRIGLLGAFEARDDAGQPAQIRGTRLRTLLARLALDQERPVTTQSLVDAIWGDRPPSGAGNALHSLVSRLRRSLPPGDGTRVESLPAGYRLSAAGEATDVAEFERVAAEGRACRDAGDADAAARRFASALALWRGAPLADLADAPFAGPVIARLTELRLRTVEDHAELALAAGQAGQLVAGLRELTLAHPLDERLAGLCMRALAAAGRPAEALAAYEDLRHCLAETLGTDPSPSLRDLHTAILRGQSADVPHADHEPTPTNLPAPVTSFIGREQDLTQIHALLSDERLVTLVGPGGVGKTRLAAELAAGWRAPDGTWLAELAAITDPAEVPAAVCAALGLRPAPAAAELVRQLAGRQLLIVLDNCEHLIDACARVARDILGGCPGVRILATSREPLTTAGERVYPVAPLPVPPPTVGLGDAMDVPAVRLFADRAAAAVFGFRLTAGNLPAVAEICRRLDGLPLAIELACARLRTLPAEELAARLDDRFRLLTGGSRAALPRHQTLLAVVGWSWDLLTDAERTLARRLAVFAGGATPEAAEAVCADESLQAADVVGVLGALADKSFAVLREAPDAPARYRMLDTIRAYAGAALGEAGESGRFRRAHAAYFLARAEAADSELRGSRQLAQLAWLRGEQDNLRAALRHAIAAADAGTAVRLVAALGWYWTMSGSHAEAAGWLREALALPGAEAAGRAPRAALPGAEAAGRVPRAALATAYAHDAMHHFAIQDFARGQRSAARAAQLAGAAEHPAVTPGHPAITLVVALHRRAPGSAEFSDLARHSDPWLAASGQLYRGFAAEMRGDAPAAATYFAAARDGFAAVGDGWGVTSAVRHLGSGLGLGGDHSAAIAAMDQAIVFAEAVGAADDAAWWRAERGMARLRAGDLGGARADLDGAAAAGHTIRSAMVLAFADSGLAEVSRRTGDGDGARALLTSARRRLAETAGVPARVRLLPLTGLARLAVSCGQLAEAREVLAEAFRLALAADPPLIQDRPSIAAVTEALADLALADGRPADAARLLGYAAAVRGAPDLGNPDVRRAAAAARAVLDGEYERLHVPAGRLGPDAAVTAVTALAAELTGERFG